MTFGENLKELRKKMGLTQPEFAKKFQISNGAIGLWETDKRQPDHETLIRLAIFFNVSIDFLLGREIKEANNIEDVGIVFFNEIGTVRAGYDGTAEEYTYTGDKVEIPISMLHGRDKSEYFVLRVSGNSMYPRLLDGDQILCLRCTSVDSGTLAVVLYNGDEATVKKVVYDDNSIDLIPFNPEYETKHIEGRDLEQCRVLGKVVKLIRDL